MGCYCPPRAKRLFTSTFTAQTLGFQSHHYRRVGGFAALASGEDIDLVDRFRAAGSDLGCVGLEPTKAAGSGLSIATRKGRRSCESAMGIGSHLASSGLGSA